MTDLQVFEMNPQLNFPISDKTIYQMGFNSSAAQPSAANYVTESNSLTNHLQILDLLNPQTSSGSDDKKRQFFADLMTPHYEKQAEIEKKIDDLSEVVHQFIQSQQSLNKLILEKCLGRIPSPRMTSPHQPEDNSIDDMDPPVQEEIEEKIENDTFGQNEVTVNQQPINNPMPVYPVPISHEPANLHSPIRNRSISPEKMDTTGNSGAGMSVRDFLKNTMTVQKADEKILEEELERERDEAAQTVRYNKFRVRNRPKKYKRSAVTFTSSLEAATSSSSSTIPHQDQGPTFSTHSTIGNSSDTSQLMEQLDQSQNDSIDIEENVYQPIVVPCVQRAPELDLTLMQPVFSTASSYVLNSSALDPTTHQAQSSLSALTDSKFQTDPNNLWKAVDGVSQLLVDAPSLLESDLRSFTDHSHHSSFLPFVANHEPLHRSAFLPPQYHKDRRIHQQMDSHLSDTLRNL
ncbi:uncharacterized protein CELE_F10D11.2 [Caenorhabditis elegans]|uniref:Uncharacterized protein n=1 Tax=Caenorhabditis elegans TaxID=6239 RepID=O17777_CAEEL|nr:Uncharacterized protein CELE_F10D11.2 [Caenorhabditis elegans]CAB02914.2 Uncharacterized protein CELE_F10D11.2 [Caenorhabditis elegans]|eukprot:NP_492291.2 Uncharacterized protein CELE_F10D11.2 [Caenorhabditis elegans]